MRIWRRSSPKPPAGERGSARYDRFRTRLYQLKNNHLGGFLKSAGYSDAVWQAELGKHKVPTLRNVDLRNGPKVVKAFGHNGYFKSLEEIVHFYNTRDVETWPEPEVPDT